MLDPTAMIRADPLSVALRRKARNGEAGAATNKQLAAGHGWRVVDVLCTSGPRDRRFEERYWSVAVSLVLSGAFFYRSGSGAALLSPGTLLLGNVGHTYECSHEHNEGDRCLSFQFEPAMFEKIARDAGSPRARFHHHRVPPVRETTPLVARAMTPMRAENDWEEVAFDLAGAVLRIDGSARRDTASPSLRDRTRVADVIRAVESDVSQPCSLQHLAGLAGLSEYHFLRTFRAVTGTTPHQWLSRARLCEAALQLAVTTRPITEIALEVGFDDLSNFLRAFRAEFGVSPGRYRAGA
jgi:AraC family transcriptional regulator